MGIFDHSLEQAVKTQAETIKKQSEDIRELTHENKRLYRELIYCLKHNHRSRPVKLVITFLNNKNPSTMSLELNSGQTSTGTLQLLYADDNSPVPGVTFANTTAASDNEAVATVSVNSDGTLLATGVSAGAASATVNSIANFSDSSGARSEAVTVVEQITVDAVIPPARPVKLAVNWSTPA